MKIKSYESDNIDFYYNKAPSNKIIEMAKYCLENINISNKSFEPVKMSSQRKVFKVNIGSENYYFKKYNYRNLEKRIKNIFRKSSAYRAFKISNELIEKRITVVKPILAAEYKHSPIKIDSVFITKDFGGINLQDFIAYKNYSQKEKEKIIIELAKLWAKLYKNNYINGDPNLPGVLLNFDDGLQLSFVDVDNFKQVIYLSEKRIIKNLAKFNAHSYSGLAKMDGKKLTDTDRKLFLDYLVENYSFKSSTIEVFNKIDYFTYKVLKKWGKEGLMI
jgi:hypothetical protein